MSILSVHSNRRQETVSMPKIVLNNKTGPLFLKFNSDAKTRTVEPQKLELLRETKNGSS